MCYLFHLLLVAGEVSVQYAASGNHGAHGLGFFPHCNVHCVCSQNEEPAGKFQRSEIHRVFYVHHLRHLGKRLALFRVEMSIVN